MYMKRKKSIVMFLGFILMLSTIAGISIKAEAATQSDAVAWANAQIGKGLDYDGVYGNQCVDLIKYYYAYFGYANYAMGNANAYITNNLPPGWTRVYGNYQPGDIAVWKVNHSCGTCTTGEYGHVGIITSADATGFNAVNQNFNSNSSCTQNWFYCSALACAIRPSFTNVNPDVTFADFNENGVWETNAEFYVKLMNPNRAHVTAVGCYLYNASGTLIKSYSESCSYTTPYVNYNCNINNDMKFTLSPGTTYKYVLYGVVNGIEYRDVMRSFKTKGKSDDQPPKISDVSVYDVNETGYKVKCKVTDNFGVERVQFPTWTISNGQDDLQLDWGVNAKASGTFSNGYWVYEVKVSDHKNELGVYNTHIYAYDEAGNYAFASVPMTTLKKAVSVTQNNQEADSSKTNISTAKVSLRKTYYTYNGKKKRPAVIVKIGNTTLSNNVHYKISYRNNKSVGTASVTVTGIGNYNGSITKTFRIVPKGTSLSLSARKKGFTINWKKQEKSTSGYQIQYSAGKRFTKKATKVKRIKTNKSTSLSIFKLKSKKKYYVRIRTYKTVQGEKYYSSWSKVKVVITKK